MHIPHIALDHNTVGFVKNQYQNNKKEIDSGFEEAIKFLREVNDSFS